MKLQELRKAAGLSQSQLAKKSGVTVFMIQHYEQGFRNINGAAGTTLLKLAKALDTTIENLLEVENGEEG